MPKDSVKESFERGRTQAKRLLKLSPDVSKPTNGHSLLQWFLRHPLFANSLHENELQTETANLVSQVSNKTRKAFLNVMTADPILQETKTRLQALGTDLNGRSWQPFVVFHGAPLGLRVGVRNARIVQARTREEAILVDMWHRLVRTCLHENAADLHGFQPNSRAHTIALS